MKKRTARWLARLALPFALALAGAGCPPGNDDDDNNDSGGDDDSTAQTDDDDSASGDDDDVTGDDDATTGDDDNMDYYGVRTDDGSAPRHPALLRDLDA